jgi:hypothetical protein
MNIPKREIFPATVLLFLAFRVLNVFFACLMIIWMDCRPLLNHIIGFQEEQPEEETE